MNNNQEFFLFIQYRNIDGEVKFAVDGADFSHCTNGTFVYKGIHCLKKRTNIKVRLISNEGTQSHIQIERLSINNIDLTNMQNWSVYVDSQSTYVTTRNFGYMNQPGTYFLNIKQSPIAQNYINYFLSRCTSDSQD